MGPKAKPSENRSMEDLQSEMNEKLSAMMEKIESLTATIRTVKKDNEDLKQTVLNQADLISHLQNELNEKELYSRSWSVRFLNVQLPPGQETDTRVVMDALYRQVIRPILEGALAKQEITTIPSCDNLLETAHILPGKGPNKPVIARFYSRYWKGLIFKYRREYAPRESQAANNNRSSQARTARMKHPFFEHLTNTTFKQLKSIQNHQDVQSAWTVSGVIKFKLKNSDSVYKVSSIFDSVESLTSD
jgi:DNA repair exonuclease SbcCD ATPase subunit